jgi:hypothetical protein
MAKPKPLEERLRTLLEQIDPVVLSSLAQGKTRFTGFITEYQLGELQKLILEPGAAQFIQVIPEKTGAPRFTAAGAIVSFGFDLNPSLLNKNKPSN